MFDDADIDVQRMIVAQLIERVTVFRGYELDIEFNVDMECFDLSRVKVIVEDSENERKILIA